MSGFVWRDGERVIHYGEGVAARAAELLEAHGWDEFELLAGSHAGSGLEPVLQVPPGQVPELAAGLLDRVGSRRLVAWGGGRVIDVAKAIAAALGGEVCAVPTTLSGAEMTGAHRLIAGHEAAGHARPVLVLADPELMTSLPERRLRASAMNALAHGAEALYGPGRNPVAGMAALSGIELIAARAYPLGSLLCAYAMDSAGFALHHVLCQSLVRACNTPHAETHAALLPHTMAAVRDRAPEAVEGLAEAVGATREALPQRLAELGGDVRIDLDPRAFPAVARAALSRAELANTPGGPVGEGELLGVLVSASAAVGSDPAEA